MLLLLPLLLFLLVALPQAGADWTKLEFQTGYDAHGPCPATVGSVDYPQADCAAPGSFTPVEGQKGQFRSAECSASVWGLELRGFVQCLSRQVKCWVTAGTVFAKLPPQCNPGVAMMTSSFAGGDASSKKGTGEDCPGSVINIAADGSMSLVQAQPEGC